MGKFFNKLGGEMRWYHEARVWVIRWDKGQQKKKEVLEDVAENGTIFDNQEMIVYNWAKGMGILLLFKQKQQREKPHGENTEGEPEDKTKGEPEDKVLREPEEEIGWEPEKELGEEHSEEDMTGTRLGDRRGTRRQDRRGARRQGEPDEEKGGKPDTSQERNPVKKTWREPD